MQDVQQAFGGTAPGELPCPLSTACDERGAQIRLVDNALDAGRDCLDVRRIDQFGGAAGDFRQRGGVGRDHGTAKGHGLQGRMAEGFGHRDVDQRVGLPVEGTDAVVRHRAEQGYRVADPQVSRHAPQVGGGEIGVGAGDAQLVRDGIASA